MKIKIYFLIFLCNGSLVFTREVINNTDGVFVSDILKTKENSNWFSYGTKKYYVDTSFKANFYGSWQYCRQQNMNLLSINSKEESDRISKFLTDKGLVDDHYWTSANNLGDGETWVWLSTGKKFTYTNWYPGQPDNYDNEENCMEIKFLGKSGLSWNDEPCLSEIYFICESTL